MQDRQPSAYTIRPSGLAVPAGAVPPEPTRPAYGPTVAREFASLDELDAFLDEGQD